MKTNNQKTSIKQLLNTAKLLYVILPIVILMISGCKKDTCKYGGGFPWPCNKGMDVAFLIDYTGSMGGAIDSIKANVAAIAGAINTYSAGNYRLSLSIFDEVDTAAFKPAYLTSTDYLSLPAANKIANNTFPNLTQFLTSMENFSAGNITSFSTQLAKLNGSMSIGSGVGGPEPGGMLLDRVINANFCGAWRSNISKIAIIITDAQDGGDDDNNTAIDDAFLASLAAQANAQQIQCILVSTLPGSNYELSLINNNNLGMKIIVPNFNSISSNIIQIINQVCN